MKKFCSLILAIIFALSSFQAFQGYASAISTVRYDPDAAIAFAKAHCAADAVNHTEISGADACDGGWLCAEFVAECLRAGGFPTKLSAVAGMSGFAGQITNYGEKISSTKSGAGYVKMSTFDKPLSKGDPIVMLYGYESGVGNGHIVIYSGETASDGTLMVYAHNARRQNEKLNSMNKVVEIFAVHIDSEVKVLPNLLASRTKLSLGTQNDTSVAITVTCEGDWTSLGWTASSSVFSVNKTTQNGNKLTFKIRAKSAGTDTLKFSLYDSDNNVIATKNVTVTVTEPTLVLSESSVELNLSDNTADTVMLTLDGDVPSDYSFSVRYPSSIIELDMNKSGDSGIALDIESKSAGIGTIACELIDPKSDAVIASANIQVTVSGPLYMLSYDANGGNNAPADQTKSYNQDLMLTSSTPSGESYTVTYDGNGGTTEVSSQTYSQRFLSWNTERNGAGTEYLASGHYSENDGATLYAQWSTPTLNVPDPVRSGYRFIGWYDSSETNSQGLPTGQRYTAGSPVTSNLELYAMWSQNTDDAVFFGDYNLDGEITFTEDIAVINDMAFGRIDYTDEELFRCDVNADGVITADDADMLNDVRVGSMNMYEMPCYLYYDRLTVKDSPKTTYQYGEDFDVTGLVLEAKYTNGTAHTFGTGYTVTGYDPYTIGVQRVTVNYWFASTDLYVTVKAPKYNLHFNANGGTVYTSGKTVTYGNAIGALPTPTRDGYRFIGWSYEELAASLVSPGSTYSYMSDKTLYAQWIPNMYTVTYDANGGYNAPSAQTAGYESKIYVSSDTLPQRTGYTFLGYSTARHASAPAYVPGDTVTVKDDITLYAVWSESDALLLDKVTEGDISFGGQSNIFKFTPDTDGYYRIFTISDNDLTVNFPFEDTGLSVTAHGTDFSTPYRYLEAGKTYYTCIEATNSGETGVYVLGVEKEFIQYSIELYNEFDADITEIVVAEGDDYVLPTLHRYGYTFGGWKNIATGENNVEYLKDVRQDYEFRAIWEPESGELQANSTSGAVIPIGGEMKYFTFTPTVSGTYVIYSTGTSDTMAYLYDAQRNQISSDDDGGEGRNFRLSYDLTAGTKYIFGIKYYDSSVTGTISFSFGYVYTVSYDANGGDGAPSPHGKDYGMPVQLAGGIPTRNEHTFLGWSENKKATSPSYQPGASYGKDADVTLYAVWRRDVALSSISVYSPPEKTMYYIGDTLDLSGLVITLTYNNGSTENITEGFTVSGFDSASSGKKMLTVSYDGMTADFDVTVETPSIALSERTLTLTEGDNESLSAKTNPEGAPVAWSSYDSRVAQVTDGAITAYGAGKTVITARFTYNGITYIATCTVTVNPAPTEEPTEEPTETPTLDPTEDPTVEPTLDPTEPPTVPPTDRPSEPPYGTDSPATEPALTGSPVTEPPLSQKPDNSPTSAPTTKTPVTGDPTTAPASEPPESSKPTDAPTGEPPSPNNTTAAPTEEPITLPGDVNDNGFLDAGDATMILRHVVGSTKLNKRQRRVADINGSDDVDAGDATMVLRRVVYNAA